MRTSTHEFPGGTQLSLGCQLCNASGVMWAFVRTQEVVPKVMVMTETMTPSRLGNAMTG